MYLRSSLSKWKNYTLMSMAEIGLINETSIKVGETIGDFYLVRSRKTKRIISVIIVVEDLKNSMSFGSLDEFVAFALKKETHEVSADDYCQIEISGLTWGAFRTKYIDRLEKLKEVRNDQDRMLQEYPRIKQIGVSHDIADSEYIELLERKKIDPKATKRPPDEVIIYFHVQNPQDWSGLPRTYLGCPTALMYAGAIENIME